VATSTSRALYMSAVATYAYRWRQLQAAAICILGLLIFRSIRSRLTLTTGTSRLVMVMVMFILCALEGSNDFSFSGFCVFPTFNFHPLAFFEVFVVLEEVSDLPFSSSGRSLTSLM